MSVFIIAFIVFIVGFLIVVESPRENPNVFVAFSDDKKINKDNLGFIDYGDDIEDDEYKVLVSGHGLDKIGVLDGNFYMFKKMNCSDNEKLNIIGLNDIVLIDLPEIKIKQVFEVSGIDEVDGSFLLSWYNDYDDKRKVFRYYPKVIIGIM